MTYPSTFFQNRRSFDVPQSVKCSDLIHMLSLMFATETDAGLSPAHCRYLRQRLLSKRVTLFLMADSFLSLINTMGCASLLELFQNKARINVVSVQLTDLFARTTYVAFKNALFNSFLLYHPDNCSEIHSFKLFKLQLFVTD